MQLIDDGDALTNYLINFLLWGHINIEEPTVLRTLDEATTFRKLQEL